MSLTKLVNGKRVEMTPEEEQRFNASRSSERTPPTPSLAERMMNKLKSKGVLTEQDVTDIERRP